MAQIHSFSHLHKICESAAKKTSYPLVLKELKRQVPRDWMPIAESTVLFFLPRAILDLPTKQARRAALDSIPNKLSVRTVGLIYLFQSWTVRLKSSLTQGQRIPATLLSSITTTSLQGSSPARRVFGFSLPAMKTSG